jgi:vanillate monooxygenase
VIARVVRLIAGSFAEQAAASGEESDMSQANGHSSGDISKVPDTFTLSDWPQNCWYAAAYDVECRHQLLARTIGGHHLVIYRRQDGRPVALENACWHRLMPLSHGTLEGDNVTCGYHGLVYNEEGRCTFMPSQKTINPAARVRAYPVVERHRFVWVWTGDPAIADPDLVPDLHWNDDPEWAGDGKLIHVDCNYKLIVDNLMDLTHETFVHGASIGQRSITEVPFEVTHGSRTATVTRWMEDVEAPPFWKMQMEWKLGEPCGRVDRWQIIHFEPPGTVAIDVGVAPTGTGAPDGDRSRGVNGFVLNTMTPETEHSCHYFWAFVRNYRLEDQRITTLIRDGVAGVFAEDEEVLAAQQRGIDAHPDKQFYNLNIDGGAMWARRLIDKLMAAEADDQRYERSARDAASQEDEITRVEATEADARRLGLAPRGRRATL